MAELIPCLCDACVFFPPSSGDGKPCCVVVYEDDMCWKHCPTCGAEMEPDKNGQRGEKDGG